MASQEDVDRVYYSTRLLDHLSVGELTQLYRDMSTPTIDQIRNTLDGPSPAYVRKQLHTVPDFPVVDREKLILDFCRGRSVLDIGASGPMHAAIRKVATQCVGIDRVTSEGVLGMDLDDVTLALPKFWGIEAVVCGEVLEHLSNPGFFLQRLRDYNCATLFSVPNAFSDCARIRMAASIENVNFDHVCWFSYKTLSTLLSRFDYHVGGWYWYKGRPLFAEGLIAVCHARGC